VNIYTDGVVVDRHPRPVRPFPVPIIRIPRGGGQ
jgi:hypothetical protein